MGETFAPLRIVALGFYLHFLAGCYSGNHPGRIGTAAPDFTVQDSDHKVTLSQYRGQIVVLNFWATWCPPCIEETPALVKMTAREKDKGVVVLAVSIDADDAAYHKFLKDYSVNMITVRDEARKASNLYGTFGWPESYIIDRQGVIRRKFIGAVDWTSPEITDYLSKLVKFPSRCRSAGCGEQIATTRRRVMAPRRGAHLWGELENGFSAGVIALAVLAAVALLSLLAGVHLSDRKPVRLPVAPSSELRSDWSADATSPPLSAAASTAIRRTSGRPPAILSPPAWKAPEPCFPMATCPGRSAPQISLPTRPPAPATGATTNLPAPSAKV